MEDTPISRINNLGHDAFIERMGFTRDRDAWALLSFAVELCEHFVRNFGGDFEFSG
jgi:hypothetical protein